MTAREYVAARTEAGETTILTVLHPDYGQLDIPAYGAYDAAAQAALEWDAPPSEMRNMTVRLEERNINREDWK